MHYVDWGNPMAPPLLLVHGGRDHCRNWDWVARRLRKDWHVIAPDLRGHGDSQWSPDGNYSMSAFVYDIAQLIHQQKLAPVTIVAHSLGGNISLRYAGVYPESVRKLVAIEGLGPSPKMLAERGTRSMADRIAEWVDEQRKASGPPAAALRQHRGSLPPHAGGEQAPLADAGAPSHRARRQPERGRHLQLEVRQLRARMPALRHELRRYRTPVGANHLSDAAGLRQGELGLQSGEGRPARAFQDGQGRRVRRRRALGAPRPARRLRRHSARVHRLSLRSHDRRGRKQDMKAAIFRGGDIVVDSIPEPVPGTGQALVKVLACGICGSDLHAARHSHRMVEVSRRIPGRVPMDLDRDVVMGHEFCCEVIDYGPNTEKKLKPGTRVCSMPVMLEPDGPKGMGYSNTYVGGYAEQMLLAAPLMLEVPNGLATEHAALTEPLAVGVHAVEKAVLKGDEAPLVVGCGPVGLAVIAALRLKNIRPIVAADFSPKRRELAVKMGADVVVDPAAEDPYAKLAPGKRAALFECVGVPGLIQQTMEKAPRDAKIVVVGVCMELDTIEPMFGIVKELNLQFVLGYTPEEFARSLRLLAEGEVDAASLITAKVGLDGVKNAFAELGNPERQTKILVEPWR
ncbi:MAG: alpha/beta fold hydrolase [Enhydrobacter sp.]|nr:alpha/beta fold hydrolase [Enhydrobacter sp.]